MNNVMGRILIIAVIAGVFLLPVAGQSAEEDAVSLRQGLHTQVIDGGAVGDTGFSYANLQKRSDIGMSVGTSFSYMKGYGSGVSLYAAPTYSLALTPRLSVHAGLIASSYTGLNLGTGYTEYGLPPVFKSLAVFGAASYRMTERLTVHGAGVKYLVNSSVPPLLSVPSDHLTVGATYKLGDNIFIGGAIRMDRGNRYSPFGPIQDPFYPVPYSW